jgi:outer membrane protein TolC
VQVKLNNLLSQIELASNNLDLAKNSLKNAMGMYDNSSIVLGDTAKWLNNTPQPTSTQFTANNTIPYLLLNNQIELYHLNAKSIMARGIPSLSAFARYGVNGFGKEFEKVFENQYGFSTIGLKLSWNLFNGFTRNAQYQEAIIQMRNAQLNQKITAANENLQFQNAQSQLLSVQKMLSTNKENVNLASEVYDIATLEYKEGTGSLSDLLNAETSYQDAQNNYIQSLIKYYLAQLDMERTNNNLENYYKQL